MIWLLAVVGLASGGSVRLSVLAPESDHVQALPVILPIIDLAVRNVSHPRTGLLPGWNISTQIRNTFCSSTYGPLAAFDLYQYTDAFLGPVCDYVIAPVCRFAGVWGKPVITAGAQADHFYHKMEYPTLTRVMGSYRSVSMAMRQILHHFDWKIAGLLYFNYGVSSSKGQSKCRLMLGPVFTALGASSVHRSFSEEANATDFRKLLEFISKSARIVVVCADPPVVREILLVAEELNMIDSGEYVFFNIELFNNQYNLHNPWYVEGDTPDRNSRAKKAFTALLTVTARTPDSPAYRNFSDEIKAHAKRLYNYTFGPDPVSTFVTAFYDAVLLYAIALNQTLANGGNQSDGNEVTKAMWNRSFEGITGTVDVDGNGDRITDYSLLDMDPETNEFKIVAHYIGLREELVYVNGAKIHWSGGRDTPPPDTPKCGFDNSLCKSLPVYAILTIVLGSVVIILAIASAIMYRHYKLEAEIASMTWRIYPNEIVHVQPGKFRGSIHSLVRRGSQLTVFSEDGISVFGDVRGQVFVPTAIYKGNKVAIKSIPKSRIDLNRALLLELKRMKDLHHDHLVKFYGACIDPPNCCIMTEYCPKGSLQDILENEQIKLDWMFRYSLMHDIVKGMAFLHHSDIRSHGSLKSSNCVVDSRFVLKIADFGLRSLRGNLGSLEDIDSYAYWKSQ